MKVSAYFHFAQRPVLVRKVKQLGGEENREEVYVVASENDYRRVMELWSEIRETTETSAPGHIIKFFHQVVLKLAEEKDEFAIEDLTQAWNSTSENRKSSKAIRNWVRFLSDVGYLTSMPDPNDKRRKLISVIKDFEEGKNARYGLSDLCAIFSLDSLKEWLSKANKISLQNQVLLQEKSFGLHEPSVKDIYRIYFRRKTVSAGDISKKNEQPSLRERTAEKTQNSKKPYSALFTFQNFKQLTRLRTPVIDRCAVCGFQGRMDWQVTMPDGSWSLLCGKCGLELTEKT